jgi:putative heme iron utilization protein
MDADVLAAIRHLLTAERVLALAVLVDGEPEIGLLPFAVREDFGAVYVQASGLARHTRGLRSGSRVGVLIHAGDSPNADPMQLARMTVQANVERLDQESSRFAAGRDAFVARFPSAAMTLELGDFNLYELTFGRGRYVEGFARAFNLGPETFRELGGS